MEKTKRVITLEFGSDDAAEAFVDFIKDAVDDCLSDGRDEGASMRLVSIEKPA
jgi:hypothetical protein